MMVWFEIQLHEKRKQNNNSLRPKYRRSQPHKKPGEGKKRMRDQCGGARGTWGEVAEACTTM